MIHTEAWFREAGLDQEIRELFNRIRIDRNDKESWRKLWDLSQRTASPRIFADAMISFGITSWDRPDFMRTLGITGTPIQWLDDVVRLVKSWVSTSSLPWNDKYEIEGLLHMMTAASINYWQKGEIPDYGDIHRTILDISTRYAEHVGSPPDPPPLRRT